METEEEHNEETPDTAHLLRGSENFSSGILQSIFPFTYAYQQKH